MNWTELDSSEVVLQMRTIDFEQGTKLTQCEERSDSSNKWCETPYLSSYVKLEMIKHLNARPEIIKILEENGENLLDRNIVSDYFR